MSDDPAEPSAPSSAELGSARGAPDRWQLVEDALWAGAGALADKAARLPHWFAAAVVDRSRRYTSEREALDAPADREADLAARALFFSPVDAAKVAVPLAELRRARGGALLGAAPAEGVLRVVDLGAGCGAMSLGLLACAPALGLAAARWELTLVDRDGPALAIARAAVAHLAQVLGLTVAVKVNAADLATLRPEPCELVLAGTVLNELPAPAAREVVSKALAAIKGARGDGAVVLVEPALREPSRRLHELRDELLATRAAAVIAPCVRRATPCPMLARPTDWCHEDRPFSPPRRVRPVASVTHLRDGSLKYAYLVLAHQAGAILQLPPGAVALRVVSGPLPGKGRREQHVCGDLDGSSGRVSLRRLDRRRRPDNAWVDDLRRGDLLEVPAGRAAQAAQSRLEIGGEEDGAAEGAASAIRVTRVTLPSE